MTISWKKSLWLLAGLLTIVCLGVWLMLDWVEGYAEVKKLEGKDFVIAKMDAVKIGLSVLAGSGALYALYLGVLRQNTADQDLHDRRAAQKHTELDADARRVTELYTKAADQLGSDKAAVRLAGLYALERLAQDTPDQRRTIINVLCAYLRMPFERPIRDEIEALDAAHLDDDLAAKQRKAYDERVQEREVRLTAQRILSAHLRPDLNKAGEPQNVDYWPGHFDLDLTGGVLLDFDLSGCTLSNVSFHRVLFVGETEFAETVISGDAVFSEARFITDGAPPRANFRSTVFNGTARFSLTRFSHDADFTGARFDGEVDFLQTPFQGEALFVATKFRRAVKFTGSWFNEAAQYNLAQFSDNANFDGVTFFDVATFTQSTFRIPANLEGARVSWSQDVAIPECQWPSGWTLGPLDANDDSCTWEGGLQPTSTMAVAE